MADRWDRSWARDGGRILARVDRRDSSSIDDDPRRWFGFLAAFEVHFLDDGHTVGNVANTDAGFAMSSIDAMNPVADSLLNQWMRAAVAQTLQAVDRGEAPFGAGIYSPDGEVVVVTNNQVRSTGDPTRHAEVCAIAAACQKIGKRRLSGFWLVATAEPCLMCLTAAATAGIDHIAFGAVQQVVTDAGFGSLGMTGRELAETLAGRMEKRIEIRGPILESECVDLLMNHRR